jgi:hypothetical protein
MQSSASAAADVFLQRAAVNTWEDSYLRAEVHAQLLTSYTQVGPPDMQLPLNCALFFIDSKHLAIRVLRRLAVVCILLATLFSFAALYLYLDVHLIFALGGITAAFGSCMGKSVCIYCLRVIQPTSNSDGQPSSCLRVFSLMDQDHALAFFARRSLPFMLYQALFFLVVATHIPIIVTGWGVMSSWGCIAVVMHTAFLVCPIHPANMTTLFFRAMEGAVQVINKLRVFVNREDGSIDWERTQQNFDLLCNFVEELSAGFRIYFFLAEFCIPLGLVLQYVGLFKDTKNWILASTPLGLPAAVIVFEFVHTLFFTYTMMYIWCAASEVTRVCEEVQQQGLGLMAYVNKRGDLVDQKAQYLHAKEFHDYMQRRNPGFASYHITISYTLGLSVFYAALMVLFSVVLPLFLG